jgi:transposase-like protein
MAARLFNWQTKYPKLCPWVEENIEETLTYYRLPLAHHKHMRCHRQWETDPSGNMKLTHRLRWFLGQGGVLAANAAVARWLRAVANARGHATTNEVPAERLVQAALQALAARPIAAVRRAALY